MLPGRHRQIKYTGLGVWRDRVRQLVKRNMGIFLLSELIIR